MVRRRALPIVSAVLALCWSSSATSDGVTDTEGTEGEVDALLEPTVTLFTNALPKEACDELIRLGEQEGFGIDKESIDENQVNYKVTSQSIEVFEKDEGVISNAIWEALQPHIPSLTEYVKKSIDKETDEFYFPDAKGGRTPKLDWVFFRKYSPETERNSLLLHVDSNMHTLNIALNDDFDGGGLFYAKPVADQDYSNDDRPDIAEEYQNYNWTNGLKRENTTDLVFPDMHAGDVLVHNFTVWHAVAPIERGTRYSFVLFYDMDNPAIQGDFDANYVDATFYHEITDATIDLLYVEFLVDENGRRHQETSEVVEEDMQPFEEVNFGSYKNHVFRAVERDSGEVLAEFVIDRDVEWYEIEKKKPQRPPALVGAQPPLPSAGSSSDEL